MVDTETKKSATEEPSFQGCAAEEPSFQGCATLH